MESTALLLIVTSALFHALWNVAVKRVEDRFVLLALAHVVMAAFLAPLLGAGAPAAVRETPGMLLPLCGATFFFSLYHLGVTGGYRTGDLSLVYPVTTMAPALAPFWGWIFLGGSRVRQGVDHPHIRPDLELPPHRVMALAGSSRRQAVGKSMQPGPSTSH